MKIWNKLGWTLFVFFAIGIGLYPYLYMLSDVLAENGLLARKSDDVKINIVWAFQFKVHIYLGGIALLTGWSQFIKKWRNKRLNFHRFLGKIYIIVVLLSGISGLYIANYAEGGIIAQLGFSGLALAWLYTTTKAYLTIRRKEIDNHQKWMIRSYALTFAAVTLRIWLPMFQNGFGMEFNDAYVIIAWLCWVPNIIWAQWKVKRLGLV